MNLDSRKGFVRASRFYALVFVALTGVLGVVSPPDLAMMVAQAQTTQELGAEAVRLLKQGQQLMQSKQYQKAIDSLQQSLAIVRQLGNTNAEAPILFAIATNYIFLDDIQKGIESLRQSIELAKKSGNRETEMQATDLLNKINKPLPESTNQTRRTEADRLLQQGIQQYQISEFEAAFQLWQEALTIYREIKFRQGEKWALGNLGIAYDALGKYDKAIESHLQSLVIAREIEDRLGEGRSLGNLGNTYHALGKYDKAIEFHL